jgi:hypothetical protein
MYVKNVDTRAAMLKSDKHITYRQRTNITHKTNRNITSSSKNADSYRCTTLSSPHHRIVILLVHRSGRINLTTLYRSVSADTWNTAESLRYRLAARPFSGPL